jgi:hypothetical protein
MTDDGKPITSLELVTQFLLSETSLGGDLALTYQSFVDHVTHGVDLDTYQRLAQVKVPSECSFGMYLSKYVGTHGGVLRKTRTTIRGKRSIMYTGIGLK